MIKRAILPSLINHLSEKEITIIVGTRQAGKTTLMKEMIKFLNNENKKTLSLNLDFESDRVFFNSQDALINKIKLEFGNEKGYVFIDEIQRRENAGLFLKGIYDKDLPYKFIVTGSGSLELKESIHESLAGRKRVFEVGTIDFYEFVDYKTEYKYSDRLELFFSTEKEKISLLLGEYLSFGGYPRVVLAKSIEEKKIIISEIYSSVIEKDITSLMNINRPDAFSRMIKILASQNGQLLKYSELAKQVGISESIIKKYIWFAEKTFLIDIISPFYRNKQKEIVKSPVIYFRDLGLLNYSIAKFELNNIIDISGFTFQNFIENLLKLSLGALEYKDNLHFWRTNTGAEVDFVISIGEKLIPIEVKFSDMDKVEISKSIRSFIENYKPEKVFIINRTLDSGKDINSTRIFVVPFYSLREIIKGI